ncbi:MAG: cytochrome P450, partial [Halieaceae bacterium]|nr:cytochrome P450 [Halieaceae bacterium]
MNLAWNLCDASIMGNEASMYALFKELRDENPVAYVDHPDFEPFWA